MPPEKISLVRSKLIGVSCLQGKARDDLNTVWNERFSEIVAYMVNAEPGEKANLIAGKIVQKIRDQGFEDMTAESFVVAIFLDLTKDITEDEIINLSRVSTIVTNALGCRVKYKAFFGDVGEKDLIGTEAASESTRMISQSNLNHLWLIAHHALGSSLVDWKAVAVFLDILRRIETPSAMINAVGFDKGLVGFLGYKELNELSVDELRRKLENLDKKLRSDEERPFYDAISDILHDLEVKINRMFVINGGLQPVHTQIALRPTLWEKMKHIDPSSIPRRNSCTALTITGEKLKEGIQAFALRFLDNPEQTLQSVLDQDEIGLELIREKTKIRTILGEKIEMVREKDLPSLQDGEPLGGQMTEYLESIKDAAICKAKQTVLKQLSDAFEKIEDAEVLQKIQKTIRERNHVEILIHNAVTRDSFFAAAKSEGTEMNSRFHPIIGGTGRALHRCILCRNYSDFEYFNNNPAVMFGIDDVFFIDETLGQLNYIDMAPMKALHIHYMDGTDERITDVFQ